MKELKHQLKHERKEVDEKIDELVAFLDIQRERQTVSDAQLSLAEVQFMLLETYYVLINRRIKDLKRKRG
ncbi:crAss001_48 related protein [Limosilactobacillus mucosae]|uniref:crAss001_48 related protein n=1 Tax=Limosilactobacillus mucosae TaxID=97478 RepID=UPI00399323C2